MSFDWAEFNYLSQELMGWPGVTASHEAKCRTAISRAYYALFCPAYDRLVMEGGSYDPHVDIHAVVRDGYEASPDTDHQLIGSHLRTLREMRNVADYEAIPSRDVDMFAAQSCIVLAEDALNVLAGL